MGTMQTSFEDRKSAKKGARAEKVIQGIFESRGFIVYRPETDGAHSFDMLAIRDKKSCIALDVKAKARRTYYPDTGINTRHYQTYKDFSEKHSMPFWVIFVDEVLKQAYGNTLSELDAPCVCAGRQYPMEQCGIRYFPLSRMLFLCDIPEDVADDLTGLSARNHPQPGESATFQPVTF